MSHSAEGLARLLERHELARARLTRALEAGGNGGEALESFNADWDAETDRLSDSERETVAEFIGALIDWNAGDRQS